MKVYFPILLLLLLYLIGCKERHTINQVKTSPDYEHGVSLLNLKPDSAYYYLNKAATEAKDSLGVAQAYNRMAAIQNRAGDYFGGQESLLTSLKYLHPEREDDRFCLVSDYNLLGSTSSNLKNYDAAIGYFDQALQVAEDERVKAIALNNKAVALQEKGQYALAAAIYDSIITRSKPNKKEYARVLCNRAAVRWKLDRSYRAAPDLLASLQLRKEEKDDWGLNSSYAHLADYYLQSRPDSALGYARAMYAVASGLNSPDDKLEALQKLILLEPVEEVRSSFREYDRLKDSLETVRNRAKNQFALIRYDAERSKADNLRLQRENAERRAEGVLQWAIILGVLVVFGLVIGLVVVGNRRRRRRIEQAADAIQRDRLKTSQRVHDVVANGLYRVMTEIEHREDLDKEGLIDKIDDLYLRSRDISYESAERTGEDFQGEVAALLGSFGGAVRKVLITGNDKDLWQAVGVRTREELKLILQELMVNMKKHSGALNVVLRFEREGEGFHVDYSDDGIGLSPDIRFGNGLTNTGNRISGLAGRINFDQNTTGGLKIRIYLPNE